MNSSSTELSQLWQLTALLKLLVMLPQGRPHGKHHLLLSCIVLGMFTDPLPSNRHLIAACVGSCRNAFTESLPSNGSIRHNIILAAEVRMGTQSVVITTEKQPFGRKERISFYLYLSSWFKCRGVWLFQWLLRWHRIDKCGCLPGLLICHTMYVLGELFSYCWSLEIHSILRWQTAQEHIVTFSCSESLKCYLDYTC
jgi:hypothetical protein